MSFDAPKLSLRSQRRCVSSQDENAFIDPGKNLSVKNACRRTKKLNALSDRTNSASVRYTADSNVKTMPRKRKATVQGDENKEPLSDEIIPPKRVLNTRRALAESNNTLVNKEDSSSAEAVTVSKLKTISSEAKEDIQVPVSGVTKSKLQKEDSLDVIPSAKPLARSLRSAKSADSAENADQSKVSAPEDSRLGRRGRGKAPEKEVDSAPKTRGKGKTQSQPVSILDKAEEYIGPKTRKGKKGGEESGKAIRTLDLKKPMDSTEKTEQEGDKVESRCAPNTRSKRKMLPQKHDSSQGISTVPEKAPARRHARSRNETAAIGNIEVKNLASGKKQDQNNILPQESKTNKGSGRAKVVPMKDCNVETPEEGANSVFSGIDASTSKPDEILPQRPRRMCRKVLEEVHSADLSTGSSTHTSSATVAEKVPEKNISAPLSPAVFFGTAKPKVLPEKSKSKIESISVVQFFGKKSTQNKVKEVEKSKNKVPPSGKGKVPEIPGPVYKDARRSDLVGDGDDLYKFSFDENEEEPVKKRRKPRKKPVKKQDVHSRNPFVKPILPVKSTKRPLIDNCNEVHSRNPVVKPILPLKSTKRPLIDNCNEKEDPLKVCKIPPQPPLNTHLADKRPVEEIQTVPVEEAINSLVQHSPAVTRNESILSNKSDNNITHFRARSSSPQVVQSESSHHSTSKNCGSPVVAGSKRSAQSLRLTISSPVMSDAQSSTPKRKSFVPPPSIPLSPATAVSLIHSPSRSPSCAQPGPSSQDSEDNHASWDNSFNKSGIFDDIPATKFSLPARMLLTQKEMTFTPHRDAFVTKRKIPQFSPETTSDNPKPSTVKFSVVPESCLNTEARMTLAPALPAISQKPVVEPAIDNCFGFDDEAEAEVQVEPTASAPARMHFKPRRPVLRVPSTPKPSLKEVQAMLMGKKASAAPSTPCSAGSSSSHPKSSTTTTGSPKSGSEATPVSSPVSSPVTPSPVPCFDDLFGDTAQSPFLRPPRRSYARHSSVKRIVCGDVVCSDDEGEEDKDGLSAFSEKTTDQTTATKAKKEKPQSTYQKKKKLVQTKLVDRWANQLASHFEEIDDVELFVQ